MSNWCEKQTAKQLLATRSETRHNNACYSEYFSPKLLLKQQSWDIELNFLLNHSNPDCDDSCAGNCTGNGPKGCIECAKGYDKSDEEGCKGTFKLNVLLYTEAVQSYLGVYTSHSIS